MLTFDIRCLAFLEKFRKHVNPNSRIYPFLIALSNF